MSDPDLGTYTWYRTYPSPQELQRRMLQLHHKQRQAMKHKLTVVICIILIVALGGYAARLHHEYVNTQQQIANRGHALQVKLSKEAAQRQAQFQAGVQLDEAQCARDQAAYKALAVTVKAKTVAPDCEASIE